MNSPEFELLMACCRSTQSIQTVPDLHCSSAHVDWPTLLHLSRRHRVQGLVAQAIYKSRVAPPPAIAAAIADDAAAVAEANLRAAAESKRLLECFGEAAVPLLFVKGLSLSALAYSDPFVKMSSDIDILVDPAHLEAAANVLAGLGYTSVIPRSKSSVGLAKWHGRNKESVWIRPDRDSVVELHTRLADHAALIPGIGISSPWQEVRIGPELLLPTLNTSDLVAYLCVHGASSAWFRLKWIADLAALIHAAKEGVEDLYRAAMRSGTGRAAAQGLLLADRLGLVRLSESLKIELEADPMSRLLARVAMAQLRSPDEPTVRLLGTASIHLSQPLLLPGWRFKLSEILRQAALKLDRRR